MSNSQLQKETARETIQRVKPWLKSTGPRTPEGKSIACLNAGKHFLRIVVKAKEFPSRERFLKFVEETDSELSGFLAQVGRHPDLKRSELTRCPSVVTDKTTAVVWKFGYLLQRTETHLRVGDVLQIFPTNERSQKSNVKRTRHTTVTTATPED